MSNNRVSGNGAGLIAAERRRRIYECALRNGSVSVVDMAAMLSVAENTIRNDLDALHKDGKLVRSHGGAVVKDAGLSMPSYSQIRDAHMLEKSWIGAAAAKYLPESGAVFINAGSTTYQLVLRMQEQSQAQVTTNSPEIASYLVTNTSIPTSLLGGNIIKESMETDGSLSMDALDRLYWDVVFFGILAIDINYGISSIDYSCALLESKIMQQSRKVVGLCDSSKFGRLAHAKVGPVSLIDVLITDSGIEPALVEQLNAEGVEVIIADSRE